MPQVLVSDYDLTLNRVWTQNDLQYEELYPVAIEFLNSMRHLADVYILTARDGADPTPKIVAQLVFANIAEDHVLWVGQPQYQGHQAAAIAKSDELDALCQRLNVSPADIVFIDDRVEYIEEARARGFTAIQVPDNCFNEMSGDQNRVDFYNQIWRLFAPANRLQKDDTVEASSLRHRKRGHEVNPFTHQPSQSLSRSSSSSSDSDVMELAFDEPTPKKPDFFAKHPIAARALIGGLIGFTIFCVFMTGVAITALSGGTAAMAVSITALLILDSLGVLGTFSVGAASAAALTAIGAGIGTLIGKLSNRPPSSKPKADAALTPFNTVDMQKRMEDSEDLRRRTPALPARTKQNGNHQDSENRQLTPIPSDLKTVSASTLFSQNSMPPPVRTAGPNNIGFSFRKGPEYL